MKKKKRANVPKASAANMRKNFDTLEKEYLAENKKLRSKIFALETDHEIFKAKVSLALLKLGVDISSFEKAKQ